MDARAIASPISILVAGTLSLLFYSGIGLALARWAKVDRATGAGFAPTLGWSVFTVFAFIVQDGLGFTRLSTGLCVLAALAASGGIVGLSRTGGRPAQRLPVWAYGVAGLIALLPLAALLPKHSPDGIMLGSSASDHAKIAIIDAITRSGLPAVNPFFGLHGERSMLSYYYLWHYSAAQLAGLAGLSGWEADAALTGVTAYSSLLLMMGLAQRLHRSMVAADRADAPAVASPSGAGMAVGGVALLALSGSLWPLLALVSGPKGLDGVFADYRGLETWIGQASWVPQHLAAANSVVVALFLMVCQARRTQFDRPRIVILGALAAAAFGSSAWVGGVTFAAIATGVGVTILASVSAPQRLRFTIGAVLAVLVALVLALPLLATEFATVASRHDGSPIAFHPYEVVGAWAPLIVRRTLDLPAFWLVRLPLDLPAFYPAGALACAICVFGRWRGGMPPLFARCLGVTIVLSLAVSDLLISTIGNNDLGWRAILPATLLLIPFASAGAARWLTTKSYAAVACALAALVLSLPDRVIIGNVMGKTTEDAQDFAEGPALWTAVRRYAGPDDRVANNPLYLDDLTDWPVNPSWAFLSNRSSCYSGWETARAYVDLPRAQITALDAQFIKVFAGKGSQGDVRQLAEQYGCRVAVVVDSDGAWAQDPFAASPFYRLVEQSDQWRIYRTALPPAPRR